MYKTLVSLICSFGILLILTAAVASQAPASDSWMRVQTDDGEFSIEVPRSHTYFYNKDGFLVGQTGSSNLYQLKNMRMLNGIAEDTLVSFECYEVGKNALDAIYERDSNQQSMSKTTKIKRPDYTIRQIVRETKDYYSVRQYFYTKKNIYVLTAASRSGETAPLKRFVESMQLRIKSSGIDDPTISKLSSLKASEPEIEMKLDTVLPSEPKQPPPVPTKTDNSREGLMVVYKSPSSYTENARMKNVQGIILLRMKFSNTGSIGKIDVLRTLPEGLLRQALFAALRIKFLPPRDGGLMQTVVKTVEYSFTIY